MFAFFKSQGFGIGALEIELESWLFFFDEFLMIKFFSEVRIEDYGLFEAASVVQTIFVRIRNDSKE